MFAQAASAQEPSQPFESSNDLQRLPGELDSFVQEAISEGLLRPARPHTDDGVDSADEAPVENQPAGDVQPAADTPIAAPAPETIREVANVDYLCPETSPYDFEEFIDFTTYQDLSGWRGVLETEEQTTALGRLMARAYLSLGLLTEARAELAGDHGQGGVALRHLVDLLDRDGQPNQAFLSAVAACDVDDGLWLGIAKLKANDAAGADLLAEHFTAFRGLPLRLRANAALIIIPALDRLDRPILSERLMTSFTADEIATSHELQFVKAMQRLSMGAASAAHDLRNYLRRAQYRTEAAAALRRHGQAISSDVERDIVEHYIHEFGNLSPQASVSENLGIILQDLNSAVGYDMTLRLAALPAASDPDAKERLASHFEGMIDADLESGAFLVNLKAMDALLKAGALLEDREGTDGRYARASAMAANFGLPSMSEKLSARLGNDAALSLAQAELAFQLEDHEGLRRLTEAHPDNVAIRKVALIDAIRSGDADAFARLSRGIPGDVDTALMLIEADAAAGHWIVPQRFYSLAAQSGDEAVQVRALRIAETRPAPASTTDGEIALSDVSSRLERLRQSLGSEPTEVR